MKAIIKGIFAMLICLIMSETGMAQQAFTYNQYMNNLTPLNPAYSAIAESGSVSALARKQWVGIEGSPSTLFFTGNMWLPKIKSSAGLIVANDKAGIENQFEVQAFFAKSIALAEKALLTISVNAGIRRYSANYNELDATDPKFRDNIGETSGLTGIGAMLHSDKFYVGISVPRISLRSGTSLQKLKPDYYLMGGYIFNAGASLKLKPAVLFSYVNNLPLQVDVSATAYLNDQIGLGLNYRNSNEFAGILSYNFKSNLGIGYSYQFGGGEARLGTGTNSTQEVMLHYRFGGTKKLPSLL